MARQDDLSLHTFCACNCCVEVVDLKPEKHTVSIRSDVWISDAAMVMLDVPSVQLKNQPAVRNEPLILSAAMRTLTAKQVLIPAAARLNIAHADKGLGMHTNFPGNLLLAKRDRIVGHLKHQACFFYCSATE